MKVLVCGGRDFRNYRYFHERMEQILDDHGPFEVVMHGGASGADAYADTWAQDRGIPIQVFRADWKLFGPSAGPRRNEQMLREGKPDLVVAFPGGKGTQDMVRRAEHAQVIVLR